MSSGALENANIGYQGAKNVLNNKQHERSWPTFALEGSKICVSMEKRWCESGNTIENLPLSHQIMRKIIKICRQTLSSVAKE